MGDAGPGRLRFENRLDIEAELSASPKEDQHKLLEETLRNAVRNIPAAALRGQRLVRITVLA